MLNLAGMIGGRIILRRKLRDWRVAGGDAGARESAT